MKRLDIIYGLSNVGKTTLCKNIEHAFYINIGHHPEFGKLSMFQILKNVYHENPNYSYYITEGCFHSYDYRSAFIHNVHNLIKPDILNVFYINVNEEDLPIMAAKSKTKELTLQKYKENLKTLKIGTNFGNHYIIYAKNLEERIKFINTI